MPYENANALANAYLASPSMTKSYSGDSRHRCQFVVGVCTFVQWQFAAVLVSLYSRVLRSKQTSVLPKEEWICQGVNGTVTAARGAKLKANTSMDENSCASCPSSLRTPSLPPAPLYPILGSSSQEINPLSNDCARLGGTSPSSTPHAERKREGWWRRRRKASFSS